MCLRRKGVAKEIEVRGALVAEVDCDDVETDTDPAALLFRKAAAVEGSEAAQHTLLVAVHGSLRGIERVTAGTALDLHKAEPVALPRDQVDITAGLGTAPSARNDCIALTTQSKQGFALSALAKQEVRGPPSRRAETNGQAIQRAQQTALGIEKDQAEGGRTARQGGGVRVFDDTPAALLSATAADAFLHWAAPGHGGRRVGGRPEGAPRDGGEGRRIRGTVSFSPTSIASLVIAASFAAGLNVYATVLTLGLLQRLQWVALPPGLESLGHTWVLIVSAVLFAAEFVADKIPALDLLWNALHTFVRVPVAALVAYHATSQLSPGMQALATAAGAGVALAAHGSKTAVRAAVTPSPEPLSNIALSSTEDVVAIGLTWFATHHPVAAASTALVLLAAAVLAARALWRGLQRFFRKLRRAEPQTA